LTEDTVNLQRRVLGREHPDVLSSLNNLGVMQFDRGEFQAAVDTFIELLEIDRKCFGSIHPSTARSLHNLGNALASDGRLDGAERFLREALDIRRELFGEEHPDVANTMKELSRVYMQQGRLDEALPLAQAGLLMARRLLGETHPTVAGSFYILGEIYQNHSEFGAAANAFKEASARYANSIGSQHWRSATAEGSYGETLVSLGRYEEAEESLLNALSVLRVVEGRPRRTHRAIEALVALYEAWGKPDNAAEYRALLQEADRARP
jgi:tetratricopeptide (TPR) repeat protein